MHSASRQGRLEMLPELLAVMIEAGPRVAPDVVTFSTLINGYCQSRKLVSGLEILACLKAKKNMKPDGFTCATPLGRLRG